MRNGNLLKSRVSEIRVKRIRVNQGVGVHILKSLIFSGWNRALVDFAGGISCRESSKSIGQRYQALQNVYFVNLDMQNECRYF